MINIIIIMIIIVIAINNDNTYNGDHYSSDYKNSGSTIHTGKIMIIVDFHIIIVHYYNDHTIPSGKLT